MNSSIIDSRISYIWNRLAICKDRIGIPGLVAGILVGGKQFSKALGVENLQTSEPMNMDSLLRVASLSKPFSATMIARLVGNGKCSWDLRLAQTFKDLNFQGSSNFENITVRDGMSHRSGLANMTELWYHEPKTSKCLIAMAAKAKPMANRGSKFIYNNLIYGASVQAACHQAGISWRNALENESVRKLGLKSTAYSIKKAKKPIGYTLSRGIISPVFNQVLPEIIEPSAGLVITMNDLLKWGQYCIDSNSGDLIKNSSVNQEIWKEHIEIAPGLKYGIGFQLRDFNGYSLVEHSGGLRGFSSYMALMPEIKIGFFLVANFFPTSILSQSAGWIFETLLNKSFSEPAVSSVDLDYADKAQGEYIADYGIWNNEKAIISKSGKSLFLALPNQEKQEIQFQKCDDWHPLEFDTNTRVRIEGTNRGKASCISLRQGEYQFRLIRAGTRSRSNLEPRVKALLGVYLLKETNTEHLIIFYKGHLSLKVNGQMVFQLDRLDKSYQHWKLAEIRSDVYITFRRQLIGKENGLILRQGGKNYKMLKIAPDPMQNLPKLEDLWPSAPNWKIRKKVSRKTWRQYGTVEMPNLGLSGVYKSEITNHRELITEIDFGKWGKKRWIYENNKGYLSANNEKKVFGSPKALALSMMKQPWLCSSFYHSIFESINIDFETVLENERVYQISAVLPEGPGVTIYIGKQKKRIVRAEYIESSTETFLSISQKIFFEEHLSTEIGYLPQLTKMETPYSGALIFKMKRFDRLE